MQPIVRIVNCIISIIFLLTSFLGLALSEVFKALLPDLGDMNFLFSYLPFVLIAISVLGLYGVVTNNVNAIVAFDIILLPFWNVGTIVGGICLVILVVDKCGLIKWLTRFSEQGKL